MTPEEVDRQTVRTLAGVAGIAIPEEDMEALIRALRNHMAAMASLDELDLDDCDPIVTFDPRWE